MRKILSVLLALSLTLSVGMVAFAAEATTDNAGNPLGDQTDADWTQVKFKKEITTIKNDGALHPEETFSFTVTSVSAKNEQGNDITPIPSINNFDITVNEGGGHETVTVNLPLYDSVGTYVYKVQESSSDTAGMVYDTTEYTFTVIVLNVNADGTGGLKRLILKDATSGQKTDVFANEYKAGSLIVSKEITGNNAKFDETFPVKVTLTPEAGKKINSTVLPVLENATNLVVGTPDPTTGVIEVTFDVTNGSEVTIKNIPYNTSYKVEEVGVVDGKIKGYTVTYDNNVTGKIEAASISTDIVNDYTRNVATGISLDNIPYLLLIAGAAIGIGVLIVRRRKNMEF